MNFFMNFKNNIRRRILLPLILLMLLTCTACSDDSDKDEESAVKHQPVTNELIKILDENPKVEDMLEESIDLAKEINPDRETNPAQTLEEYYQYIDWAAMAMPWTISSNLPYPKLYEKIDQSLNYFYFINDQPLKELDGKGLYNNSLQYADPYRSWLISFTKEWGKYLDTEASWNNKYYEMAYDDERFGLQTTWYEDPANWKTFNQFFSRNLKSPDQRPIAEPDNDALVVSPADSEPQGIWQIDGESNIVQREGALIKSKEFNSVVDLIGPDSKYKNDFANGTLTHTFLDVHDYHRYHFPISGTIKEATIIPQDDAVGGFVEWDAKTETYVLNAATPGWQSIETRGCVIMETEKYGMVALLPIGMSQVSSVNFEKDIKPGKIVKKGDMLGYFLFGGSDYVMIFQKDAGFEMTASTEDGDSNYKHLLMGEQYGKLKGAQ